MAGIDFFDSVLITFIAGICTINLLLFLFYMISKVSEQNDVIAKSKSAQNKADRPYWIIGCLISGSIWMIGTLLVSGDFFQNEATLYTCIFLKVILQYTFGYILWINLIIYRLFRLFMVHTWLVKPLHAMIVLAILMSPFLLFSIVALAADTSCIPYEDNSGYLTCMQSLEWNIAFYSLALSYLLIFIFLALKVRQVTGSFKDLKRYITFCGVSFIFLVFDASMNFSESWKLITIRRLLCLFVVCIFTAQSWTIFWSVLIRKRVKKSKDSYDEGDGPVMIPDDKKVKIGVPDFTEEELMGGPIRRAYSADPSEYGTSHFSVRTGVVVNVRPRESLNEVFVPKTSSFIAALTHEDTGRFEDSQLMLKLEKLGECTTADSADVDSCLETLRDNSASNAEK